jgi:hypothetical protein
MMLLPFILLGCKPNAGLVSKPNDVVVNKPIEILYKSKKMKCFNLEISTSDELEGRESGTVGMEKSADYLVEF